MKTQKELKAIYKECLIDAWKNDEKMVNYCLKSTGYIVELTNGDIVALEKPSIKKNFCFSYGYNGITSEGDEDRAFKAAEFASKSEKYFIDKNMEQVQSNIDSLSKSRDFDKIYLLPHYYRQSEGNKLKILVYKSYYNDDCVGKYPEITKEDIKKVIEGYEQIKKDFEKRLMTYLKRYGLTKIKTWTFLSD